MSQSHPVVLAIVDGGGEVLGSIAKAHPKQFPTINRWIKSAPFSKLCASGEAVGLARERFGSNSAGYQTIGAGRPIPQASTKLTAFISQGKFFNLPILGEIKQHLAKHSSSLHIISGLTKKPTPHTDTEQLLALLLWANKLSSVDVYLHLLVGFDQEGGFEARALVNQLNNNLGRVKIASVTGKVIVEGQEMNSATAAIMSSRCSFRYADILEAITAGYNRSENDANLSPTVVDPYPGLHNGDVVITTMIEGKLLAPWIDTLKLKSDEDDIYRASFYDYRPYLNNYHAFMPLEKLNVTLPEALAQVQQSYMAENEMLLNVTSIFNGGHDQPAAQEKWLALKDGKIGEIIKVLNSRKNDFVVINLTNKNNIDEYLSQIETITKRQTGTLIVTADRVNIGGPMNDPRNENISKSAATVPLYLITDNQDIHLRPNGQLSDIAPTILHLFSQSVPSVMTGKSLIITT